ncbi:MAG: hypothetical protein WC280_03790, partial [Patescibacteria group bacterium]
FKVKTQAQVENLIREKNIKFSIFSIIYDLIEYVKVEMKNIYKPKMIRRDLGKLEVLAIFRTENDSQILGGKVIDGVIEEASMIEVWRGEDFIDKGKLSNLQEAKQNVRTVEKGNECGLKYEGKPLVQVGDVLSFYKEEEEDQSEL